MNVVVTYVMVMVVNVYGSGECSGGFVSVV